MSQSRAFHLGDVLSVTTGRLVSPTHMGGVYGILNWMTGEDLFTYQLPRAARECAGPLLVQHADLADVEVPDEFADEAHVKAWLAEQVERFGETRFVAPLAPGEHTRIDPITEMRTIRPDLPIDVLTIPEDPNESPTLKRLP
ncbi:DUF7736 domain-containing protein [Streptosporangium sp. G12]